MRWTPARVLSKGRVTIPADTRRELGIGQGDYVLLSVRPLDEVERDE